MNDPKLMEMSVLLGSVSPYPHAREVDSHSSDQPLHSTFGKTYASDVDYDNLKHYYAEQLTRLGWRFVGEQTVKDWWRDLGGRKLEFQQRDYTLTIQFAGKKADYGWAYSISIGF